MNTIPILMVCNRRTCSVFTQTYSVRYAKRTYRESILGVHVAEPLDVVEEQPGQRDDHQEDEGDGDEEHRGPETGEREVTMRQTVGTGELYVCSVV